MNTDLSEVDNVRTVQRGWSLSAVVRQILATAHRFPLASRGLVSIFDQGLVSGTSFLTAAIVGRLTSTDQFGLYYLVLSVVLLVSGVQEQVIAGPYMVLSKRRTGAELTKYGGSVWLHHLVLTLLTIGGLAVAIFYCSAMGNTTILPALWALLGAGPLLLLRDGIRRFAFGNLQVKSVVALDATVAVVQLGGLALLGYFGYLTLLGIFGVMAGACALACIGWYLLSPPHVQFRREHFLADWRHNWVFGKWALSSFMVGGTTTYVMLWILGLIFGPSETAMLGACSTLVGVSNVVLTGVSNVLTPLAADAYATAGVVKLRQILTHTAMFLAVTMGGFCLFVLATGSWLVVFVFGHDYEGTGMILFVLALSVLMNGQVLIAGNGLWAIGQPRAAFVGDAFGFVATLLTVVLLVPLWGALGAALSILSGAAITAIARTIILSRWLSEEQSASRLSPTSNSALCPEGTYS